MVSGELYEIIRYVFLTDYMLFQWNTCEILCLLKGLGLIKSLETQLIYRTLLVDKVLWR